MKFLEFNARITKIMKQIIIPLQNNENYVIHIISGQNNENHTNLIIPCRITKVLKCIEFNARIQKSLKLNYSIAELRKSRNS